MSKTNIWRCIESGIGSAQWNMAVDEALLSTYQEGDMPILRLYGWEPALSLGKFSDLSGNVEAQKPADEKISIVRRPSGGGILVHGGDLSYTLILPRIFLEGRGVKESYRHLCRFLIRLYEKMGHAPRFATEIGHEETGSAICMAGCEAYDIVIDGDKIGGNAQRHTRDVVFQHGSVPISIDAPLFAPLFVKEAGLERAVTLEKLGHTMTYEALATSLKEAFCETFGVTVEQDCLKDSEEQCARELLASKYSQERWNIHGKNIRP